MKQTFQSLLSQMMEQVLQKLLFKTSFVENMTPGQEPLQKILVPDMIFKGSGFEREFVAPFSNVLKKLAVVVARERMGVGELQHEIRGVIYERRLTRIAEVLNRLEHRPRRGENHPKPNWEDELAYILQGNGEKIPVTVICDVYAESAKTGERYAFELNASLPNSNQTKVSKEKILKLYCMEPRLVDAAFYALPYNPYGRRQDYAWSFPARWFNMKEDQVILIGDEFWEKIGGVGTYQAFIQAVNEIGPAYKERIYREYLGMEPPPETFTQSLR